MMCTRTGWRVETKPFTIMRASRSLRCTASNFLRIFVRVVTFAGDQPAGQTGQSIAPELLCHIHVGVPRRIACVMPKTPGAVKAEASVRPVLRHAIPAVRFQLLQQSFIERSRITHRDVLFHVRMFSHPNDRGAYI